MHVPEHSETRSVLEHFGELRKKIFIALGSFIIGTIIAHIFHEQIIAFLLRPAGGQQLIFLSPLDPLFFILKIDCLAGIIVAFPVIMWCIFSYITPALPKKVAGLVILFYTTSTLLLVFGLAYAFFVTIPVSLKFLFSINIQGVVNNFSAENYLSFYITQALIIMGVFQIPILIIGGIYFNAFKTKTLADKRRYIYLVGIIALAFITPTTDIFSLGMVLLPCIVIFEISLLGGKLIEFLKRKKLTQTV